MQISKHNRHLVKILYIGIIIYSGNRASDNSKPQMQVQAFLIFYLNKKFLEFLLWLEQYAKQKKSK